MLLEFVGAAVAHSWEPSSCFDLPKLFSKSPVKDVASAMPDQQLGNDVLYMFLLELTSETRTLARI